MSYKILITNGDGSLGCGVSRLIARQYSRKQIEVVAICNRSVSATNHFVDKVIIYPKICKIDGHYDVDQIAQICSENSIDLVIPLTDHECVLFSENREVFPLVLCSDEEISTACYDKWKFFGWLNKLGLLSPVTWLPSSPRAYDGEYLIKPRRGGLSRGINFGSPDLNMYSDEYIAQEVLQGVEATVAFYKSKSGKIVGPFVGERTLLNGMTDSIQVVPPNLGIQEMVSKLASIPSLVGPCNIQGMIDGEKFTSFEINLRYSGTASIRDMFGFKDVIYGIDDFLFDKRPDKCHIKYGYGVRYFADMIYTDANKGEIFNSVRPTATLG
jgi:carbamoyl-phosphate synthase large subunit